MLNSQEMSIHLPEDKEIGLLKSINKFLNKKDCKIREFASFIGSLGASCYALRYGWVYLKDLEREKFLALKNNNNNFEARMTISKEMEEDLNWWRSNIRKAKNPINEFRFEMEIFSDASQSGWGAYCNNKTTHGIWEKNERKYHINYLELLAAFFSLKCFAEDLRRCNVLLRIDNTTAISYINRMGGIRFKLLSKLAKEIWKWCESREIWVFASYISSKDNVSADAESRRLEPETEFEISDEAFDKICQTFGTPEIDLFASRSNTKCHRYVSWRRDPESVAVDAFTIDWTHYFFYAFPPFAVILKTIRKIRSDEARGIVVIPFWPSQAWFPICMTMFEPDPVILRPDINLLSSTNREPHPLWRQLSLMAGVLSNRRWRRGECQQTQLESP